MESNIVRPGDKIEIRIMQQLEQGRMLGELPPAYCSMVQDIRENGMFEISVPTRDGKAEVPPSGVRLEFVFYTRAGMYRCGANVKDRYVRENLPVVLVEPKTPLEKFQRREYYRFGCVMDMEYFAITEEEAGMGDMAGLKEHHRLCFPGDTPLHGVAVDISGGGIRFVGNRPGEQEGYLFISIRLKNKSMDYLLETVGKTILCQKVGTVKKETKYEYRANFLMRNQKEREIIIKYIFEQERVNRQKR